MKTVIFKYPLELKNEQQIEMFTQDEILCVQTQNEKPCLWVKHNEFGKKKVFTIRIYATGEYFDINNKYYIGTVQDGIYVWHVFIETEYSREAHKPSLA